MRATSSLSDTFMVGLRAQLQELFEKERAVVCEMQTLIARCRELAMQEALRTYLVTAVTADNAASIACEFAGVATSVQDGLCTRWTTIFPLTHTVAAPGAREIDRAQHLAAELIVDYSRACKWAALLGIKPVALVLQQGLENRRRGYETLQRFYLQCREQVQESTYSESRVITEAA
ncbi:MAG: hypothetical protein KDD69_10905 [Bdellovibrionales bacterium]|nr:hypothetical protein [Bdellovibrionales bacterium]